MAEIRAVASTVLDAAPLTIVRRRPARGALIPTYREFVVRRGVRKDVRTKAASR